MRLRQFVGSMVALVAMTAAHPASRRGATLAQTGSERFSDGLIPGDYLRVGVGRVTPLNPQGSLRDWDRGQGLNLVWENWDASSSGVGRIGYGLAVDYALLPLNDQQFVTDFGTSPTTGQKVETATGKKAGVLQVGVSTRFRIPAPYIMPSISLGFGFLDWQPGQISYTTLGGGSGTAKQQHRAGGAISIGGGLDKHIIDRFAIFGEALYTYAYTSFGQGLAASGSACLTSNCDLLKNTQFGVIRGGLRARIGR